MEKFNRKQHWEKIYQTKELEEVSWYQEKPSTSLEFLENLDLPKSAKIIDVGGGDGYFVDYLLQLKYENITVVDISVAAIDRAKNRLGEAAEKVTWIVADAADFAPNEKYDFWHDRAAFHFLTQEEDIENYLKAVQNSLSDQGVLVMGTFSERGPEKCSGINIQQYSERSLVDRLKANFEKIKCIKVDHLTPFNTIQHFIFCSFRQLKVE